MAQILASIADINGQLPPDSKARIDDADDGQYQIDAANVIRGNLAGTFKPTTLVSWTTPETTPPLIRSVAARLIAAKWYSSLYSEDDPTVAAYAQWLYNEAVAMLADIRDGTLTVLGVDDEVISESSLQLGPDTFWPNDTTNPIFSIGMEFG